MKETLLNQNRNNRVLAEFMYTIYHNNSLNKTVAFTSVTHKTTPVAFDHQSL